MLHLAAADPIVDPAPTWWRRFGTRVAGLFRRSR